MSVDHSQAARVGAQSYDPSEDVDLDGAAAAITQAAHHRRARELRNYEILRSLAQRGQMEPFVAIESLDQVKDLARFDEIVAERGAAWLLRGQSRR